MKLTKTKKGDTFVYEVTNDAGDVITRRLSKRDFVACTTHGEFFFRRLDLVGRGVHGRVIKYWEEVLKDPNADYNRIFGWKTPPCKERWICARTAFAQDRLSSLLNILKPCY